MYHSNIESFFLRKHGELKYNAINIRYIYSINKLIIERKLFYPEERILIAVSGGQDSIFLLSIIYRLRLNWNWKVSILHCDHKWNDNSIYQARQMHRIANNMKMRYFLGISVNIQKTEEKARIWRYKLISNICNTHNYSSVATGHTASDRIETLLYNSIRGSGLDGLQSLTWKRTLNNQRIQNMNLLRKNNYYFEPIFLYWFYNNIKYSDQFLAIQIIRPLLNITRKQIQQQTDIWYMPKYHDTTNNNINMRRNRIRNQLLPYLRKYFNPKIDNILSNLAEIIHYELNYLNNIIEYIYNKQFASVLNSLNIEIFQSFPIAIQRRILKKFFLACTQTRLEFQHIEQIRFLILDNYNQKQNRLKHKIQHIYLPSKRQLWIFENQLIINN